jgi:hypothetical protein
MPRLVALIAILAGFALHAYTMIFEGAGGPNAFGVGLMLFSWLPYIACAVLLALTRNALAAGCGAIMAVLFDLSIFYSVFIHPTSSTAALGLLFAPLWNLLLFGPLGAGIGWLIGRRRRPSESALAR